MVEAVVKALIALCLIVLCVFLALWVFAQLGIVLPAMVINILWVIVVLVCILVVYRLLKPVIGGFFP